MTWKKIEDVAVNTSLLVDMKHFSSSFHIDCLNKYRTSKKIKKKYTDWVVEFIYSNGNKIYGNKTYDNPSKVFERIKEIEEELIKE
jgi:outer membrane protein assembly factor BamD (BamD/ComL family)